MTHNEKRAHWQKELLFTAVCGVLFGAANTIVGHPFDTIKTKMQAQNDCMARNTILSIVKETYAHDGLKGFYKGWCPPLIGSMLFRSI